MKDKILGILKESKSYVSGQELADRLGVSRTAVWKAVTALKKEGYGIASVSRLGYKLEDTGDILNERELSFSDKFCFEDELSSTNEYAKRFATEGKEEFFFVTCNRQTAGRGRLGRTWISPYGVNIYLSMIFYPDTDIPDIPQMTPVIGLAAAKTISDITGLEAKIKWPNDILINDKKISGILTEMQAEAERILFVVAGIGINVNQTEFDKEIAKKASSMRNESDRVFKRSEVIKLLIQNMESYYKKFVEGGFASLREEYKKLCINFGREVRAFYRGSEIGGTVVDISEKGELVIKTQNGLVSVSGGEATVRNADNEYI